MLYNIQRKKLCRHLLVGGALCVAGLGFFSCSDRYNLDEDQPSGLDNIYGYMQKKGNYTNYLHLIDDLGQKDILSRTGSKTMFIANDDAFAEFYADNDWGVKKYEDLSLAQKKLLLNSSMVGNPYSTTMLSSAQASSSSGSDGRPVKGEVCRRVTSQSLYDSVMVIASADADGILPNNSLFNEVRANRDSIVLFTDASNPAPILHFTGRFVTSNHMDLSDIDFIYNQPAGTFNSDDIYVNNSRVTNANVFCKNGFVHEVDKVIVPLDNMAEIIRKNPKMTLFSGILERFAAPMDSTGLRNSYNLVNGTNYDSVFVKRYFSDRSWGSTMAQAVPFAYDKNGKAFDASLKFDPGWNGYVPEMANDRVPMMEDMAVMLVPTDEALKNWWDGSVIQKYYGSIEETPNSVLDDLVRVNQLSIFTISVPSAFGSVLNDANETMGITPGDVEHVYLGCNGLVYLTNKVFAPARYSSVLFPAVVDTTNFSVMDKIIEKMEYDYYLYSMVSKYVLLLPTNKALLSFIDPCSYRDDNPSLWEISLTPQKEIRAYSYDCTVAEDGTVSKKGTTYRNMISTAKLEDRLEDMLDNIIIVEPYREGKKYYKTKGRNFVKVEKKGEKKYEVSGSYHENLGKPVKSVDAYDGEDIRNGITIALDEVAMGTPKSVTKTLHDAVVDGESIFSEFCEMVDLCATETENSKDKWIAGDKVYGNLFSFRKKGRVGGEDAPESGKATYLLNNFHYTMYAPTNEAMKKAYAMGLPTLDDLEDAAAYDEENGLVGTSDSRKDALVEVMLDFVKYHIQDNAIFVDVDTAGTFSSAKTELTYAVATKENVEEKNLKDGHIVIRELENGKYKDKEYNIVIDDNGKEMVTLQDDGKYTVVYYTGKYIAGRPYGLNVKVAGGEMYVTDCRNGYDKKSHAYLGGNQTKVLTKEGAYNLMAREYWFTDSDNPDEREINNSSFVVIHAIEDPLIFADGTHFDAQGHEIKDQFHYIYKPLK